MLPEQMVPVLAEMAGPELTVTTVVAVEGGVEETLSINGLSPLSKPEVQIPINELVK